MTARLATKPEVAARASEVHDRLTAAGVDVELATLPADAVVAVLDGAADLALVDAQALRDSSAEGLTTLAVLPREDPRDALLAHGKLGQSLRSLAPRTRVGVRGSRRRAFLRAHRPDLVSVDFEGGEELKEMLDTEKVGAAILNAAEARRMGLARSLQEMLDPKAWLPAVGQGVVALVSRYPIAEATSLDHLPSRVELRAELALLDALDAPPDAPVGSLAQASGRWIRLWAAVVSEDGRALVRSDLTGPLDEAGVLGGSVARQLLDRGAAIVLTGTDG